MKEVAEDDSKKYCLTEMSKMAERMAEMQKEFARMQIFAKEQGWLEEQPQPAQVSEKKKTAVVAPAKKQPAAAAKKVVVKKEPVYKDDDEDDEEKSCKDCGKSIAKEYERCYVCDKKHKTKGRKVGKTCTICNEWHDHPTNLRCTACIKTGMQVQCEYEGCTRSFVPKGDWQKWCVVCYAKYGPKK